MKIAVLGPKGTFSESAGEKYLNEHGCTGELLYFSSIGETVKSLRYPSVDMAVVPIENSSDGYVQETLDLLLREEIFIVGQVEIPIRLKLLGNVDSIDQIRRLYVQFKAKGQCRNLIRSLKGVSLILTESNVDAFLRLKEKRAGDAAIVPSHLSFDGAPFVLEDARDFSSNSTRFVVLRRGKFSSGKGKKMSLFVSPEEDRPGMLFSILEKFAVAGVNLTSIMSRPRGEKIGNYDFYFELTVDEENALDEAIGNLKRETDVKILGIY